MIFAHYNDGYNMMGGGDWVWGMLMMLFWIVLIVVVVLLVTRGFAENSNKKNQDDNSLTIAKNRYAKGEINQQEFEQLKKDLKAK